MERLGLNNGAKVWLVAVVVVAACQLDSDAVTSEDPAEQPAPGTDAAAYDADASPGTTLDAGPGAVPDGGNEAGQLMDAATEPDPFLDAAGVVDAGTGPDPVVDAGTVPDPVVDSGTVPDPVVDSGTDPEPVVDSGTDPEPVVDSGTDPEPVVDSGTDPEPVADSGTEPEPVVDAGTAPDAEADAGDDPVVDAGTSPEPAGLTLYYIRHAEVVGNTLDPADITWESMEEFSTLGQQQVNDLTNFLLGMDVVPDVILTSPTWRAQKTIEPYLVATGLTGVIWMELDECPDAEPTGGPLPTEPTYYEYFEASIEASNVVFRDPEATLYWDNQTYEDGLFMAMTARDELLRLYSQSGLTIFVTGHAVAGNLLLGLLRGFDMTGGIDYMSGDMLWMQNTGIQVLVQDPATGAFSLEASNLNDPVTE